MGKLKNEDKAAQSVQPEEEKPDTEATLKDEEFGFLLAGQQVRINISNEINRLISSYLHIIATTRLGYEPTDDLKFEVDFEDTNKKLRIWKIKQNLFNEKGDSKE